MPQMGESIFEGTLTKWLKKPGDKVQRDEPLFEISTDKVDAEIPAPASGVLKEVKVQEGATVQVNTVVGVIDGDGAGAAASAAAPAKPAPPEPAKSTGARSAASTDGPSRPAQAAQPAAPEGDETETESAPAGDEWYFGVPWEHADTFARNSPSTHIRNAHTPTLIFHGEDDVDNPVGQSLGLYRALKHYGVETELVRYPGEGHLPRRRANQIDILERMLAWYDGHLMRAH